jgi:DNA end-binding protein Ku
MARPLWTGTIAFGLVSIPVGLFSAVQEQRPRFNQLQRGTSDRIRYKRVNEATGEEVPYEDIVRGFAVGPHRYVILDDEELAAVAPKASKTIELLDFVDASEIDSLYYDTPYHLVPQNAPAKRPYALFAAALTEAKRVGIARFVLREREHLCAVRARDGALVLETMHFSDEVRPIPEELSDIGELEPRGRELEIAVSLIDSMAATFEPTRYRDDYRDRLEQIVAAKERGEEVVVEEQGVPEAAPVIDLVSVLARSVSEARRRRGEPGDEPAVRPEPDGPRAAETAPAETPSRRAGGARRGAGTPDDLDTLGRAQLYERAKKLGIPQRSSMTREELIAALRAAAPPHQRRRRAS